MPQSKVVTHDAETRQDFKSVLKDRLAGTLTASATTVTEPQVLLLPEGHEGMIEPELLFTLTHNPELAHSRESAVLAVNLLYGRAAKPAHISFDVLKLANAVPVPEFVAEIPARRKSSGVAPGFARVQDSRPEREGKEIHKKEQFKQSLADRIHQKLAEPPPPAKKLEARVLLYPSHYEELSEADLHFALVNNPELKHSHDSALLAIDILTGRAQPQDMILQAVQVVTPFAVLQKRATKAAVIKAQATDVTTFPPHDGEGDVLLLPANYRELSETELGFVLTHTPELKHTPEAATFVLDVLFGRREPQNVKFEVLSTEAPIDDPLDAVDPTTGPTVLLIPTNYKDFSAVELHAVLLNTPDLAHTPESAALAMTIIGNKTAQPNVELRLAGHVEPRIKPPTPARPVPAPEPWIKIDLGSLPKDAETTVALPQGFEEMSEQHLVFILKGQVHAELALDIIDALKGKRAIPEGIGLTVKE